MLMLATLLNNELWLTLAFLSKMKGMQRWVMAFVDEFYVFLFMDVYLQRLEQEYEITIITTDPIVLY